MYGKRFQPDPTATRKLCAALPEELEIVTPA
jgi:hypothetical protein